MALSKWKQLPIKEWGSDHIAKAAQAPNPPDKNISIRLNCTKLANLISLK